MIEGRGLPSLDDYLALERTGRGSSLLGPAREQIWELYERYRTRLERAGLIDFGAMRREALAAVRDGRATLAYDSVIVDEAQDLTETSILLLAELSGGFPRPNVTRPSETVSNRSYLGGFSLRSVGIDVRGALEGTHDELAQHVRDLARGAGVHRGRVVRRPRG